MKPKPKPKPKHPPKKDSSKLEGLASPKSKHSIKLPKNKRRLSIDSANAALKQMGYKLGKSHFDFGKKKTFYEISDSKGSKVKVDTDQLKAFIYANAE